MKDRQNLRRDLLDGFAFLAFAMLLTDATASLSPEHYLGFIHPFVMFSLLVIGILFSLACGGYILLKRARKSFSK